MTIDSAQGWVIIIAAVAAALANLISAWRFGKAEKEFKIATAILKATPGADPGLNLREVLALLMAIRGRLDALSPAMIPAEAPEAAPGFSINSLLRFWDLYTRFSLAWRVVKGLPVGDTVLMPAIKTKVDGRYYQIGDDVIPVKRLN